MPTWRRKPSHFNPRSPHGERRLPWVIRSSSSPISIHAPRTGSDARALALLPCLREISIHAPRTGSDSEWRRHKAMANKISIHAPRTGSDLREHMAAGGRVISIHAPRTGSDMSFGVGWLSVRISIHAPRTGSDGSTQYRIAFTRYFNPRSPHGERLLR